MKQLIMATHAAAERPLKQAITSTGTKDTLAMPVINRLIAIGKLLRRSTAERKALPPEEVNKQLHDKLLKRKDNTLMNPLLSIDGELLPYSKGCDSGTSAGYGSAH